jgi:hypothetical protein
LAGILLKALYLNSSEYLRRRRFDSRLSFGKPGKNCPGNHVNPVKKRYLIQNTFYRFDNPLGCVPVPELNFWNDRVSGRKHRLQMVFKVVQIAQLIGALVNCNRAFGVGPQGQAGNRSPGG